MDELLGTRAQPERWSRSGHCVLRRGQDGPSFPHVPFLAPALFLRSASDSFSLTKPNTSCKIEWPASLRSEGVRVHPGMPFRLPGILIPVLGRANGLRNQVVHKGRNITFEEVGFVINVGGQLIKGLSGEPIAVRPSQLFRVNERMIVFQLHRRDRWCLDYS
jgi:hypothetical protein